MILRRSAINRTLLAIMITTGLMGNRPAFAQETVLYSFTGAGGGPPEFGVIRDSSGNLYGTAGPGYAGSPYSCGVVYKLDTSGHETVLSGFNCDSQGLDWPSSGVIRDSKGTLYGVTTDGGGSGTVYQLSSDGDETVLYRFPGVVCPCAGVIRDSSGNLYGTTAAGGTYGQGVVYKLDATGQEAALYTFTGGTDGADPSSGVILDATGNLYGTTAGGGTYGQGVVYKLDATGQEAVLYNFKGGTDGGDPLSGVIRDPAGNLYGTTNGGGSSNYGTVYKVDINGKETPLYSFKGGSDGGHPNSGVVGDSAGNLYGIASDNVYKVDITGKEEILYSFTGGVDGACPCAGVIVDSAGNLYGTTLNGGTVGCGIARMNDCGTVFEIKDSSGSPTVEISPSYLVFPTAGSTLPLTVSNTGTGNLEITAPPAFSGFNNFDFAVASGTTCANGVIVAPGSSCTINVTFTPLTTSAESAVLSVSDNADDSPQTAPLSGGALLASISPNPVPGSSTSQIVSLTGIDFATGATLNWRDLTNGGMSTVSPLSVTPNQLTASLDFTNATAAWQLQVANPGSTPSNWLSFEVLGSEHSFVEDDYPFQNATIDAADPYGFLFRECTSFIAWRMNRDAGTSNPRVPYFFNKMGGKVWGNAKTWNTNAVSLGYPVDQTAEVGAIAQWVNGCGGACANGHVAYVERVKQDGSIVVSEYNFPETKTIDHQFNVRPIPANATHFPQNFIHVPYVRLSANLLNFGVQTINNASSMPVTITNPTTTPVAVASIAVVGADKNDFTQTNTCGTTIPAGESCQITVTFAPIAQGFRSAAVEAQDTVGQAAIRQVITLKGSGI